MDQALIVADLHLTDKKQDEHRFEIFPWIREQIDENSVEYLVILGDLTDAKDGHKAELTNRIVNEISMIQCTTFILMGNHDYYDRDSPFFLFLNYLRQAFFITEPKSFLTSLGQFLFLPHTPTPEWDWQDLPIEQASYIFTHQAFTGSIAQSGEKLSGASTDLLQPTKADIYSGDIHVPQKVGPVEYVGSPYHIHFGDDFNPRCLLLQEDGRTTNLHFQTKQKHTFRIREAGDLEKMNCREGDQVKVRLALKKSELVDWSVHRREITNKCKELGLELHGVELEQTKDSRNKQENSKQVNYSQESKQQLFERFCEREQISGKLKKAGEALLE